MIQQVASSARQTLAAAKATSLQRCVRHSSEQVATASTRGLGAAATDHRRDGERHQQDSEQTARAGGRSRRSRKDSGPPPPRKTLEADSAHVRQGTEMIQGGTGARRSRRARRIVTRAATYITLLRTQREIIS